MTKKYCDICEKEISVNMINHRFKDTVSFRKNDVNIEILCGIGNVVNQGELCLTCLMDAIEKIRKTKYSGKE